MTRRPAYLDLWESGELQRRAEEALAGLGRCRVCPRNCDVDRVQEPWREPVPRVREPLCHVGRRALVSSWFPHFGEEDVLRGWNGSGTIFFSWCNLKCVFCQNWETSNEGQGVEVDADQLASMMLDLQGRGCHNINFVTPEHVVPQVLEALVPAIDRGLRLPLVYNTSGYDSLHSLRLLDGVVDVYMPDFKYWTSRASARLLKAKDYPDVARAAIAEMHRQVGDLQVDSDGLARRGLLVRHLVMPGGLDETGEILRWLAALSPDTYVNVMAQYRPAGLVVRKPRRFPELTRRLAPADHAAALELARKAGLRRLDVRRPHPRLGA